MHLAREDQSSEDRGTSSRLREETPTHIHTRWGSVKALCRTEATRWSCISSKGTELATPGMLSSSHGTRRSRRQTQTHSHACGAGSVTANCRPSSSLRDIIEKRAGKHDAGNRRIRLIMFHYACLPAAGFTVLFPEELIRKLFLLNDSWGKNQVANFSETHEGVLTEAGDRE